MRIPKFRLHKATGQGYVEIAGHRYYLGRFDLPETEERYRKTVAEHLSTGGGVVVSRDHVSAAVLCAAYLAHAEAWYRKGGRPTSQVTVVRAAIKGTLALYASEEVDAIGPVALRTIRQQWVDRGLSLETCNKYAGQVVRMFKWGASHELVPVTVYQALATVETLAPGRTTAREPEAIQPVSWEAVEAVEPHVSRQVWGMIRLQWLSGARSGEVCRLRSTDIDTSRPVWEAEVRDHKTAHRGKKRVLRFGEQAQAVLREYLPDCPVGGYLFRPREAVKERRNRATGARRPNQRPDARKTDRRVGECYSPASYRRAIERACIAANIAQWHPHQLRHTFGTAVRDRFGLDAAQVALGHSCAKVTEIYAKPNDALAVRVASEMG